MASASRSGRYARRQAWEAVSWFFRRTWYLTVLVPAGLALVAWPFAARVGPTAGPAVIGAAAASGVWAYGLFAIVWTGAAPDMMGASAETSTADEFGAFRRAGWRLINGLRLTGSWDIDHVVVGPRGILVVETKWSGHPWPLNGYGPRFMQAQMGNAATQVSRNAKDLTAHLPPQLLDVPVTPVVVLWTGAARRATGHIVWRDKRTVIVHGPDLKGWLRTFRDDEPQIDTARIDTIWAALIGLADEQDDREASADKRVVPSLRELATDWLLMFPVGVLVAMVAFVVVSRAHDWRFDVAEPIAAIVVGSIGRRYRMIRRGADGWIGLHAAILAGLVGAVVYDVARR